MSLIKPLVKYQPLKDNSMLTEMIEASDYSDADTRQEIHDILKANCKHYNGLGIAANQLGMKERVFFLNGKSYFNPEVLEFLDEGEPFSEGCLSFYEVKASIVRYGSIKVSYKTLEGEDVEETLEGIEAIAFQHEIDHLNGVTILDRISANLSKKRFLDKVKKQKRKSS